MTWLARITWAPAIASAMARPLARCRAPLLAHSTARKHRWQHALWLCPPLGHAQRPRPSAPTWCPAWRCETLGCPTALPAISSMLGRVIKAANN